MQEVFPLTGAERSTRDIKVWKNPPFTFPLSRLEVLSVPIPVPIPILQAGCDVSSLPTPIPFLWAGRVLHSHPHLPGWKCFLFPSSSSFPFLIPIPILIPIPNPISSPHQDKIVPFKSFQPRIFSSCFFFLLARSMEQIQSVIHANQEQWEHPDHPIVPILSLPPWNFPDFPALNKNNLANSKQWEGLIWEVLPRAPPASHSPC